MLKMPILRDAIRCGLFLFVLLVSTSEGFATTHTWGGGGTDNLASDPANWLDNVTPHNYDTVVFSSASTRDAIWQIDAFPDSVSLDQGYTGTLTWRSAVPVTGNVSVLGGTLIIENFLVIEGGTSHSLIASAGSGGTVTPEWVSVSSGASQTFAISPSSGYRIADVTVDGVSLGAVTSYTFNNVTTPHTLAATFAPNTYKINASVGNGGTVTPSSATVYSGDSQTFTITPGTGYHIAEVFVDGASQGTVTSYTFNNVTSPHTLAATFAINRYIINASSGSGGTVTPPTATVNSGTSQAFTITPDIGYHVADVRVDGVSIGATGSYTFTDVITVHTIAATFGKDTYTITATAGNGGCITPSGQVVVDAGATQAFTVTPNNGYHTADIIVDGISEGTVQSGAFADVAANHTITATFAINSPAISIAIGSPSAGSTIYRPDVRVEGTVANTGNNEIGVMVNGVLATVYGNTFVANHVPLEEGINTLTATTVDTLGEASSASVTVTSVVPGDYISLKSTPVSGIIPVAATLTIDGSFSMDNSAISVVGPVQPSIVSSGVDTYYVEVPQQGVYYFTSTVIGPDSSVYQDTIAVSALNEAEIDALLRNKWNSMVSSLGNKDLATALQYISPATRPNYQQMYTAIIDNLPAMVATQVAFNLRSITDDTAMYDLITHENGVTHKYEVVFRKDAKGLWALDEF